MTPALDDALARRAVACKHFHWRPGMRSVDGEWCGRVASAGDGVVWWYTAGDPLGMGAVDHTPVPDLDDAATLGCLLALVREAWGTPEIHIRPTIPADRVVWTAWCGAPLTDHLGNLEIGGDTEAEALVSALEAAP